MKVILFSINVFKKSGWDSHCMHADDQECATTCDALNGLFVWEQHCKCRKRIAALRRVELRAVLPNLVRAEPFDIRGSNKVLFHRVLSFHESRQAKIEVIKSCNRSTKCNKHENAHLWSWLAFLWRLLLFRSLLARLFDRLFSFLLCLWRRHHIAGNRNHRGTFQIHIYGCGWSTVLIMIQKHRIMRRNVKLMMMLHIIVTSIDAEIVMLMMIKVMLIDHICNVSQ